MKKLLLAAAICSIALLSLNMDWLLWLWKQAKNDPLTTAAEVSATFTLAAIIVGLMSWLHQQHLRKHPFELLFITCRQHPTRDYVTTTIVIQNHSDTPFKVLGVQVLEPSRYYIRGLEDGSEVISKTASHVSQLFGGANECAPGARLQISHDRLTRKNAEAHLVPSNNLNIITDKGDITLKLVRPEFSKAEEGEPTYTLVASNPAGHLVNRIRTAIGRQLPAGRIRQWLLKTG